MNTRLATSRSLVTILSLLATAGLATTVHAQQDIEFGDRTPYYEDDALLDITEWFDGNDYNPTDEAWWRWDDETYERHEDVSGDRDTGSWYGYTTRDNNDWYYDYYDPTTYSWTPAAQNGLYTYGSRYYDFDRDGTYDAMSTFYDRNADGTYENYNFYSFTDKAQGDKTANQQKKDGTKTEDRSSRQMSISGTIDKIKSVKVRGGNEHLVAAVTPREQQDQTAKATMIDLGPADKFQDSKPKAGDTITAKGPRAKFGEHLVVLASSVELNGKTVHVDRSPRMINARVLDTHEANVHGRKHQMAIVETSQKGKTHKVAVDLGPADKLGKQPNDGDQISFSGFPVKVNDRALFLAQSIHFDGRTINIDRQMPFKNDAGNVQAPSRGTGSPSKK
jgi:hypothetical protein